MLYCSASACRLPCAAPEGEGTGDEGVPQLMSGGMSHIVVIAVHLSFSHLRLVFLSTSKS